MCVHFDCVYVTVGGCPLAVVVMTTPRVLCLAYHTLGLSALLWRSEGTQQQAVDSLPSFLSLPSLSSPSLSSPLPPPPSLSCLPRPLQVHALTARLLPYVPSPNPA